MACSQQSKNRFCEIQISCVAKMANAHGPAQLQKYVAQPKIGCLQMHNYQPRKEMI